MEDYVKTDTVEKDCRKRRKKRKINCPWKTFSFSGKNSPRELAGVVLLLCIGYENGMYIRKNMGNVDHFTVNVSTIFMELLLPVGPYCAHL